MTELHQPFVAPTFVTLGPERSDHENAAHEYLRMQGLLSVAGVDLVPRLIPNGLERVRTEPNSMLFQCGAHQEVNAANMRHPGEVFMVDAFMHPTMEIGLVVRSDVPDPKRLGLMPATTEYVDLEAWEEVGFEESKPVVAEKLLEGEYDAGVVSTFYAQENPDLLRVAENFGSVMTAWLVFANRPRPDGVQLGDRLTDFFTPGLDA